MRSRELGAAGFTVRQFRAAAGAVAMVFVLVAVLSAMLVGGPSLVHSLAGTELRAAAARLGPIERSLAQRVQVALPYRVAAASAPPAERWWGPLQSELAAARATFPSSVQHLAGPAKFLARTGRVPVDDTGGHNFGLFLQLDSDPLLSEHFALARGRWPAPSPEGDATTATIEIALGRSAAGTAGWTLGTERTAAGRTVRLVGILADLPVEPDLLSVEPPALSGELFDDGDHPRRLTVVGFVADGAWGQLGGAEESNWDKRSGTIWYPTDVDVIDASTAGSLVSDLRRAEGLTASLGADSTDPLQLRLTTGLADALESAQARVAAAGALQWVAMAGPFAAALAVLCLGLQAWARRRVGAVTLLVDRGADPALLRRSALVQALGVGLPAWIVGAVVVKLTAAWPVSIPSMLLGALAVLVPVGWLAGAAMPRGAPRRADLRPAGSRSRWVVEIVVLLVAAGSVVLLLSGALETPAPSSTTTEVATVGSARSSGGTDLLVVLAPALAIVAICVITLRLYPVPLSLLRQFTRRRRGLVAHLGVTRSLREPAVGLPLILSCLTGVAVAVFSVMMLMTVDRGIVDAGTRSAGSDLTMIGAPTFPQVLELARTTPGVAAAASLGDAGPVTLDSGAQRTQVEVFFGDTAELAKVQASVPRSASMPPDLGVTAQEGAPVPVVLSSGIAARVGTDSRAGTTALTVVGTGDFLPGAKGEWLLVDVANVKSLVPGRTTGDTLLMALDSGTDAAAVQRILGERIPALPGVLPVDGDGNQVGTLAFSTAEARQAALRASPTISGMRTVLIIMSVLAGVLTMLAIAVISVAGAKDRGRLLALLHLMGLRRTQAVGLTAWEQGPPVLTAVLVGGATGLGVAALVRRAVDLRAFTGDTVAPDLVVDPTVLGLVVGGFAALVLLAVVASAVLGVRRSADTALRADP